jgi:hypothetical protein
VLTGPNLDLIGQRMSDSRTAAKRQEGTLRREKRISHQGASALLWLGIKLCLSSLAATRDKAQQTQTGQQHGIGFGFGDTANGYGGDLPMVIDSSGIR